MDESPIAIALADVMVYDDARKEWLSPDGNIEPARSQVQILHNAQNDSFRIVGTRIQDKQWIMNCNVYERLRYKAATPTFHQWRDEKRKVYGLSFVREDEARVFARVVTQALAVLTRSNEYQNGSDLGLSSNGIYQEPNQLHHNVHSAPSFRDNDDESLYSGISSAQNNIYRKSSQSVQNSGVTGAGVMLSNAVQRRASQGSSSSSNGSSLPPNAYAITSTSSPSRPAPAVPAVNNHINTSSPAVSNANVAATVSSTAPPPPPPPPPPSALSLSKRSGSSIADQLKKVQLRKVTTQQSVTVGNTVTGSSNRGRDDLFSELEATLSKRKNQCDNSDSRSAGEPAINGTLRRPWEKQVNGSVTVQDSPKPHRKIPSSISLNQDEQRLTSVPSFNLGGTTVITSTSNTVVTPEILDKWKDEILNEIRQEINKAKSEIIDVLHAEIKSQRR